MITGNETFPWEMQLFQVEIYRIIPCIVDVRNWGIKVKQVLLFSYNQAVIKAPVIGLIISWYENA